MEPPETVRVRIRGAVLVELLSFPRRRKISLSVDSWHRPSEGLFKSDAVARFPGLDDLPALFANVDGVGNDLPVVVRLLLHRRQTRSDQPAKV